MRKNLLIAALAAFLIVPAAEAADQWLHIAVDGSGRDSERVRVNVPLTLVEAVLPLIEKEGMHHGKLRFDDTELRAADIVNILKAVRDAEDGEYVTVEDGDEFVRVAKEGDLLTVQVVEGHRNPETVNIRIPIQVLDAMVSEDSDELDLMAGIEALGEHGDGEIVAVSEEDAQVRIWVDRQNSSD